MLKRRRDIGANRGEVRFLLFQIRRVKLCDFIHAFRGLPVIGVVTLVRTTNDLGWIAVTVSGNVETNGDGVAAPFEDS